MGDKSNEELDLDIRDVKFTLYDLIELLNQKEVISEEEVISLKNMLHLFS